MDFDKILNGIQRGAKLSGSSARVRNYELFIAFFLVFSKIFAKT